MCRRIPASSWRQAWHGMLRRPESLSVAAWRPDRTLDAPLESPRLQSHSGMSVAITSPQLPHTSIYVHAPMWQRPRWQLMSRFQLRAPRILDTQQHILSTLINLTTKASIYSTKAENVLITSMDPFSVWHGHTVHCDGAQFLSRDESTHVRARQYTPGVNNI